MVETEESFTYTEFRDAFAKKWNLWRKRKFGTPVIIGTYSDGTRFFWEDELGDRHYGLISNLSSFSIARTGTATVTLGIGVLSNSVTDTISPALNDSTLANWRLFCSVRSALQAAVIVVVLPALGSTTTITLKVVRQSSTTTLNSTGVTVDVSLADLVDVDVLVNNPHGSDAGVGPHGHTVAAHTIVDPTHSHTGGSLASTLYTVDWMIVHK